jgi:hypothetical protein
MRFRILFTRIPYHSREDGNPRRLPEIANDRDFWLCGWCSCELGITFGLAIVVLVRAGCCGRALCLDVYFRATGGRPWGS